MAAVQIQKTRFMNAGRVFTEKYLKLMFKQLRDATPEEVMEELEHCRRENRRPVRLFHRREVQRVNRL